MERKIKVGIVGGAGYTGGELLRLLIHHPNIDIVFVHSNSQRGKHIYSIHPDLTGEIDMTFTHDISQEVDILFLCLAHNESIKFLQNSSITNTIKIIDLSQDFRVNNTFKDRKFTYGLPELYRTDIIQAQNIANPGCFATALQLSILPAFINLDIQDFYITGITGSTGAGQALQDSVHFSWRLNNIQAYKTLRHQHLKEIIFHLSKKNTTAPKIKFIPWRGNFTRGIFISSYFQASHSKDIIPVYKEYYTSHPFVHITENPIHLKQVINTNKCFIQIEKIVQDIVVHTCIDNLLKGSVGQAIQNFNIMHNLNETTGLHLKPIAF